MGRKLAIAEKSLGVFDRLRMNEERFEMTKKIFVHAEALEAFRDFFGNLIRSKRRLDKELGRS
jgi:hypothetical protein